jgi:16S rRNA A1518/A1519 N6-dimethyltransferase RsmA/KsgA/DIM1 with predicted DNA glycosylase/AP lyase activity
MNNLKWSEIHNNTTSWREKIVGEISNSFIIPRYLEFFSKKFSHETQLNILEIGAGNGDISTIIYKNYKKILIHIMFQNTLPKVLSGLKLKDLLLIKLMPAK